MSEPMSNLRLTKDQIEEGRTVYRLDPSKFEFELDLIGEIDCLNAEIERLEKALEGSESLRHTIMTAALDAKRTFTKRIAELETVNANLNAAYKQLQENIAKYQEDRK